MYGGIGDHLLANRFVPAIIEQYMPNEIDIIRPYLNNIDEHIGKNYPLFIAKNFNFYNKVVYVKKTYSTHPDIWIDMQNTTNEFDEFINYDKVYNFVPDSMIWKNYTDLPLAKYYKFFPKPDILLNNENKNYIFFFPTARENQHAMHQIPKDKAKKIVEFAKQNDIKLLCPVAPDNKFLINYCNEIDLDIHYCDLDELWQFSKNCNGVISCDSGPRFFPLHFGKPEVVVTNFFNEDFMVRWLLNPNWVMPMESTTEQIFERLNILLNPIKQCLLH